MRKTRTRPSLESLDARAVPAAFTVDDSGGADFTSIQAAVDAAALTKGHDTIQVYPGTYTEQVLILGEALDGLHLRSVRQYEAVIRAPGTLSEEAAPAVVRISGAERVTVDGFTISGPAAGLEFGVLVDGDGTAGDTSATIRDNRITDIRPGAELGGDQTGFGVYVAQGADAKVFKNDIRNYQKGGVVAFDDGTVVEVKQNTITGAGLTPVIAQNGVQISLGAAGKVTHNVIADNRYSGPQDAQFDAAGVVLGGPVDAEFPTFSAGRVEVSHNTLLRNEAGIIAENQTAPVQLKNNDIRSSDEDGIALYGVVGADLSNNRVSNSGRYGLNVTRQSSGNTITNNTFVNSGVFDIRDDTVGGGTAGTANTYKNNKFNTAFPPGLKDANKGGKGADPGDERGRGHGRRDD
jgi:parallel beta-helix repeat protein